jgi:hypothetical protein
MSDHGQPRYQIGIKQTQILKGQQKGNGSAKMISMKMQFIIINEYEEGGLNMPNIQSFYKALKMSWLHKLLDPFNHSPWKVI